ncbi:MBL fold metallo-hydrolase [Nocardioides psychrotolerans]|uniref:Glyoxylase, beta-lactamase superfamily II n=1 Tax=Nocardioides psychrotolerans TaxID=1005945 RepID=A0A1I3N072_9ACTN|nr:MBL fold metallo-hydrolase [Nocardioides psychrotolerans]GEP39079.1 MBL fold metallo-hydrolase [Nocardioides psychrotolerans]SFJ02648.1 Glyoxylase, beta-lactamase superfamily II [Nocardioides psychrotolerans]
MIPDSAPPPIPGQGQGPGRDPGVSTAYAVSPDSGEHWTAEGAWRVADGIFRIPLPLPMDGLRAINVYAIETGDGLTLVDGGWSIPVARELLDRCLREVGYGFGDIRRFLVTHVHRDHYTMARVLGTELGADVSLGLDELPAIDLLHSVGQLSANPFVAVLVSAGARDVADQWVRMDGDDLPDPAMWAHPDTWLSGDQELEVGTRVIDAVHTPGHTPGHFVFADRAAGLLFAGDHVLPTITPSIGFTVPPTDQPLGDFMASLTKVRGLPDLTILPAHGPVAPSSHTRVDELLVHHERRLAESLHLLAGGPRTSYDVAQGLGWTRHETPFEKLDVFSQGMASMETKAHLELLVARGRATREEHPDGVVFAAGPQPPVREMNDNA